MSRGNLKNMTPDANTRRKVGSSVRQLLASFGVLVGCMVWIAAPASARQAQLLTGIFGSATSVPADPYPLTAALSIAVDLETHDVYVADISDKLIEKFDSAGHLILMFGKEVDRTTGADVCTVVSGDTCQNGVAGSSPGAFEYPRWIAVDNSGVPGQQGDVYVSDGNAGQEGIVSKFDSEGNVMSSWGDNREGHAKNGLPNGQLNGANATGSTKGPFGSVKGIAVDPSGNLWVNSGRAVFEFRSNSSFVTAWTAIETEVNQNIAVDSEDNIYIGSRKFKSSGVEIGEVVPDEGFLFGQTIDPLSNELYVISRLPQSNQFLVNKFGADCGAGVSKPCVSNESFSTNGQAVYSLTIDPGMSADTLYAAGEKGGAGGYVLAYSVETVPDVTTSKATGFGEGSATLTGNVNPDGVELEAGLAGCRFEWGEHGVGEPNPYGHSAPCDKMAAEIGAGTGLVEVHATINGLQSGSTYHFRLVAANQNQHSELIDEPTLGSDLAFGPPLIESTSALSVDLNSAMVQAQVNPNNVDTRIRVEYGVEAGIYGHSTSELGLSSGGSGELASFQFTGLEPRTVYHYRVVAENALGEGERAVDGPDRVFVTQGAGLGGLPDGRVWELISPALKRGAEAVIPLESGAVVQSSSRGDAFTFLVDLPTEAEPAGSPSEVQVLSRRTAAGWVSSDIALPHEGPTGTTFGQGDDYRFFSADLSLGLAQPFGSFVPAISPEASEQTPFLRTDFTGGNVESPCVTGCYRPLVTGAEGHENVPAGTEFATPCPSGNQCGPQFVGATPDLDHVVLVSENALLEGAPAKQSNRVQFEGSLYEWSGGQIVLVSFLPDGRPAPASSAPELGYHTNSARNAISADGSRVVWSNSEGLFERNTVAETTVKVASSAALFQFANSDGSRVIFSEAGDLRECQVVETEGQPSCQVSDLSPAATGETPDVQGLVPGASEDGSYVYFVANGVLQNNGVPVVGAGPGDCVAIAGTGECNLYVSHQGVIRLIATLSSKDDLDWDKGGGVDVSGLTDRVSPDGRWFAFVSSSSLTGYDNRDTVSGEPDEEVFLYDAEANGGEGRLVCASCDPTGARPHGAFDEGSVLNSLAIDNRRHWAKHWVAADLPDWIPYSSSRTAYQSRYLFDSGRLFFNSVDALVPQDSNGTADVYELEPPGIGGCSEASPSFSVSSGGCVELISSGTSKEESAFADASKSGEDAFFFTTAQLARADVDRSLDVYDARVAGGFGEPPAPPVCEGDACQSPFAAPTDQTPGSLTYHGPGNQAGAQTGSGTTEKQRSSSLTRAQRLAAALRKCRRQRSVRRRAKCVNEAKRRYGPAGKAARTLAGKHGGRS